MIPSRTEAREAVASPGKFQGLPPIVPILWGVVLMGTADECEGSLALVGRWVLWERDDGFVVGCRYPTAGAALAAYVREAPEHAGMGGVF